MVNDTQTPTPGPGHGQYLRFECGRTLPDMMLRKSSQLNSGSRYRKKVCPFCHADMINKILRCVDCEKWFLVNTSTSHRRIRCRDCATEHKKVARAIKWRNRDKTKKTPVRKYKFKKVQKRIVNSDCKFYLSNCLPKAAFEPKGHGKVCCNNCPDYEQKTMHAKVSTKDCDGHIYNLTT